MDQVIYLEKFVESTANMPPELNRILRTIRELDVKSEDLATQIQENFETVMAKPPGGKGDPTELAELRKRIHNDQALLIQWAEEKAQLAITGHELLDVHFTALENDIHALDEELRLTGQLADDGYGPDAGYSMEMRAPEPVNTNNNNNRRGGSSRLQYAASYDSLEPTLEVRPAPAARKTTIPLTISRQQSGYGSEGYGTGSDMLGWDAPKRGNTRRAGPAGGGNDGYGSRRRAASAAVHATAAAVAALDEDEAFADPSVRDNGAVGVVGGGDLAMMQFTALEPFVPGLVEAAKEPQAPGRPLTISDIGPALVGRVAEVYWPDEDNPDNSLWYLVKIESVDMAGQTASIRYQNGEMEEKLSLAEVAREGHMLLINQSRLP